MADSAMLRQAYTSNGLCLDGGGTFMLPRVVGLARSLEIAGLDEPITAPKALEWGLVNRVVLAENTFEEALSLAQRIGTGSLNSFGQAKKLLTDSFDAAFEAQLERERAALAQCAESPDGREGMTAFLEKRKPVFHRPE
jgi:2-(1,2-epoxy-1,2-dihydrophenyl)acetyl-CoA isomerase